MKAAKSSSATLNSSWHQTLQMAHMAIADSFPHNFGSQGEGAKGETWTLDELVDLVSDL